MNLGIFCGCEGPLRPAGERAICLRCQKTYPHSELEKILKLLRKADYEPQSPDQQAPTVEEKRTALNLAARKLARLKLKVLDMDELPRQPERPAQAPVTTSTSTWSYGQNTVVTRVYVRVVVY